MKKPRYWARGGLIALLVIFLLYFVFDFSIQISFGTTFIFWIIALFVRPIFFLHSFIFKNNSVLIDDFAGIIEFCIFILPPILIGIIGGLIYNRSENWNNKSSFISFFAGLVNIFMVIYLILRPTPTLYYVSDIDLFFMLVLALSSLVSLIFGITGLKSKRRKLAIIGLISFLIVLFLPYLFPSVLSLLM